MTEVRTFESPMLKETLYGHTTSHGLEVYVLPRRGFTKKHATLTVNYGAVDTSFTEPVSAKAVTVPEGIAHFLEHKMFEREDGSAFDEFAKYGASANAYTDYTGTTYLFSTTDNFEPSLAALLDFVQDPYFTDETVEKEKGIITQELLMYEDMPMVKVDMNLLRGLYRSNPVRVDIGGTPDSIKLITKEMLYTCYNTFYHPQNMALFVTGDLVPERVFEMVEKDQAKRKYSPRGPIARSYPDEPAAVNKRYQEETMPVSLPTVLLGFKDHRSFTSGAELVRHQAACDVLLGALFGRSSDAYRRLYEARLINDKFAAAYDAEMMYSHAIIGGESQHPDRLASEVRRAIEEAATTGIAEADIERLKRSAAGGFVSFFNYMEQVARLFNSVHFKNVGLFEYYEMLRSVSADDVNLARREVLDPEKIAISLVKP